MLHSAQAVGRWPFNTEAWFRFQTSPFVSSVIQNGSQYCGFPLSVSFQQFSLLIFIYMLLLPEGQTGEAWLPSEKQCSLWSREELDRKVPSLFCTEQMSLFVLRSIRNTQIHYVGRT